jgi:type IX secretion system PorP/SprF family membrane protein
MKKYCFIFLFISVFASYAQDPEFSQYYAAPLSLNPAFTGTASDHRFILNHRIQWPSITNGFVTSALSYDYNMESLNSGIGLMIMTDKAGTASLKSTLVNFQYAYKVNLDDKWVLSSGLNFGVGNRNIDFSKLVFGDQLEFDSDSGVPSDDPSFSNLQRSTYFDFGGGILAYNRKFWLGFSAMHLNNPNRSLVDEEAQIPVKTSVHGGVRIPLYHGVFKKDRVAAIMPSFVYKQQGQFDQLDLGTYFLYEPVVVGVWYRGIPIQQNTLDNVSQDAVVVVLGFQLTRFEISYSYDLTVSELGPSSGGTHELALKFKVDLATQVKAKKKQKFIPCPTFNKD